MDHLYRHFIGEKILKILFVVIEPILNFIFKQVRHVKLEDAV